MNREVVSPMPVGYNLRIQCIDPSTRWVLHEQVIKNRVVTSGRNKIRDAMYYGAVSPISLFAIGTGSTPASDSDIGLQGEIWRDAFSSRVLGSSQLLLRYYLTPANQNGQILREAGVFHTDGTLYARTIFNDFIEKTSAIAVLFVWTLTWEAKT